MGLNLISGTVSHLAITSETSGSIKNKKGVVRTTHKTSFRVDGKPAFFQNRLNIGDGDKVVLAGQREGGEFRARAIRNDSTGVEYFEPGISYLFGGFLLTPSILPVFSILLSNDKSGRIALLVLIPLFLAGVYLLVEGKKNEQH